MYRKIIEEASNEQLRSFMLEQFAELKRTMPSLYRQMECELYESVHGPHFNKEMYDKAVDSMENADGSEGPHWSVEAVLNVAKSKGISFDTFNEYDLAYAMNMAYSDFYGVVPDNADSFFKLAKAFIMDKDAPEGKAYLYYKAMKGRKEA